MSEFEINTSSNGVSLYVIIKTPTFLTTNLRHISSLSYTGKTKPAAFSYCKNLFCT